MRAAGFLLGALLLTATPSQAQVLSKALRAHLEAGSRTHALVLDGLELAPSVRVFLELDLDAAGAAAEQQDSWQGRRPWVRAAGQAVAEELAGRGFEITHDFEGVAFVAGWIDPGGIEAALASPYVTRVLPDSAGHAAMAQSLPLANLSDTRNAGLDGEGVTVAVIDSGVQKAHPALVGSVVAEACFCSTNCCPNNASQQTGSGAAADEHGHGTNVTGILTSAGAGVAPVGATPAVEVVAVRVLDDFGSFSTIADLIDGIEWVVSWSNANDTPIAAINMSLATNLTFANNCDNDFPAFAQAVDAARDAGMLSVAASGNNGIDEMSAPGCLSDAVSVAAVWDANVGSPNIFCSEPTTAPDKITCFSNRNTHTDLLAPGAPVTSTGLGGGTSTFFGTSQAAPMVSACAVAMRQAEPDVSPTEMIAAMKESPRQVFDSLTGKTFPRLDCQDAVAEILPPRPEVCGDADGDGEVRATDALAVLRRAIGIAVTCPPSRCDFDGSGDITASDALSTLHRAVGRTVLSGCDGEG